MKMVKLLATAATLALASLASTAQAATFLFTFTAADMTVKASGSLTTSDTLNAVNGYDVLSISGNVMGNAITALTPNPNQPNTGSTPTGNFLYDNVILMPYPHVTTGGILFQTAGFDWNIYRRAGSTDNLVGAPAGTFAFQPDINGIDGTFALSAVPEPATWGMMLSGFGLVGFGLRRRRATARFAAA